MQIKLEYILIVIIVFFGLHLLIGQCNCERFSVGAKQDTCLYCKNNIDEGLCDEPFGGWKEEYLNKNLDEIGGLTQCCEDLLSYEDLLPYVDLTKIIIKDDDLPKKVYSNVEEYSYPPKLVYIDGSNEIILHRGNIKGVGAYGRIYMYSNKSKNITVALKVFKNREKPYKGEDEDNEDIKREIEYINAIESKGDKCDTVDSRVLNDRYILMEIMDGSLDELITFQKQEYVHSPDQTHKGPSDSKFNTLPNYIEKYTEKNDTYELSRNNMIKPENIIDILTKLARDLKCLYDSNYIYSDLKTDNILYKIDREGEMHVRLGDLGSIMNIDPTDPAVFRFMILDEFIHNEELGKKVHKALTEKGINTLDEMQRLRDDFRDGKPEVKDLVEKIRIVLPAWYAAERAWTEQIPQIPDLCGICSFPIPEYKIKGEHCHARKLLVWQLGIILLLLTGYKYYTEDGSIDYGSLEIWKKRNPGVSIATYYVDLNLAIDRNFLKYIPEESSEPVKIDNTKLDTLREKIFRIKDISELEIDLDGILEILDPEDYYGGYAD